MSAPAPAPAPALDAAPAPAPLLIYTDGSCTDNGGFQARAGWAAVACDAAGAPALALFGPLEAPPHTNNRGEITAVIAALAHAEGARGRDAAATYLVRSDSNITVRTLAEWLPARRRAGTAAALKNLDLLEHAEAALARAAGAVRIEHVRGHQPRPPAARGPAALLAWAGNEAADFFADAGAACDAPARLALAPLTAADLASRAALRAALARM